MSANYFVDLHVLQTVPPSCVNRDDTNSPKVATYGGTLRSRVSSQAWKHAMRESFTSLFSEEALGKRTKHIVEIVEKEIMSQQPNLNVADIENDVIDLLTKAGLSINSKTKASDTLCFISKKQAEALAYVYLNRPKDEKAYTKMIKEAIKNNPSVDMALFGRMIASDASLNYDACAQVAHAISTHEVHTEYDYFTAVDDCSPEDTSGAGHIGTVEYNSSTMYRYATVNVKELHKLLGDETPEVVAKFAESFILSMPTGKMNTFANRTVPDLVYVTVRTDQPVSFCGAFEKAVERGKDGYVEKSEERLFKYAEGVYSDFVSRPVFERVVGADVFDKKRVDLKTMLKDLEAAVGDQSLEDKEVH